MVEPTHTPRSTQVELHAKVAVLTIAGFMDQLRQTRQSATRVREKMSPQPAEITFTEPTNGTL